MKKRLLKAIPDCRVTFDLPGNARQITGCHDDTLLTTARMTCN